MILNWGIILALKIILSLTTGSMLSMWFGELITKENLGNGSAMIIFISIVGRLPANFREFTTELGNSSALNNFTILLLAYGFYLVIVATIVLVQESYKRVEIVSTRQLSFSDLEEGLPISKTKEDFIPVKLNHGGVMPLVFSTTVAVFLFYFLQFALSKVFVTGGDQLTSALTFLAFVLNLVLVIFFSAFYALLVLKPKELSENLTKMVYNVRGLKQGKETTKYLEQVINRLAFMGGVFLAFLAFFPLVVGSLFKVSALKNLTSIVLLVGVITDIISQVKGYLVSRNFGF
jgi:preprotein translocase subunit SecY